jgi:hypothetical protein
MLVALKGNTANCWARLEVRKASSSIIGRLDAGCAPNDPAYRVNEDAELEASVRNTEGSLGSCPKPARTRPPSGWRFQLCQGSLENIESRQKSCLFEEVSPCPAFHRQAESDMHHLQLA